MSGKDWLAGLNVGDKVIVETFGTSKRPNYIGKVESLTRTRIRVGGSEYNRETGTRRGDVGSWGGAQLCEATPEAMLKIRAMQARIRLREMKWSEVPEEKLFRIEAILKEQPNPPATPDPQAQ